MTLISLAPTLALMYFYISTFRSMCAVPNMAVFCSSLTSWFPGMVLTYFTIIIIGIVITHNDAPQSVGLLLASDQLVAETSTWKHTTNTTDKHPCPRWDSNHDHSRRAAVDLRLRPRGQWDRMFIWLLVVKKKRHEKQDGKRVFPATFYFTAYIG
jgi:hypothetical protein